MRLSSENRTITSTNNSARSTTRISSSFDVSASAKNLIELTGRAWTDKIVGFLCAAGGRGSYMSVMNLVSDLMLDFRSVVVPRFVFADESAFADGKIVEAAILDRLNELVDELVRFESSLTGASDSS